MATILNNEIKKKINKIMEVIRALTLFISSNAWFEKWPKKVLVIFASTFMTIY